MAARRPDAPGRPARPGPGPARQRGAHHPAAGQRLHRGGTAAAARPDGHRGRRAHRLHGHRHADRRPLRPAPAPVRLLHPAVRPGDQPAAGRDQGRAGDLPRDVHRRRAEPARPGTGLVPPDRAALPGDQRQRPGQDHPHQRRRQPARVRRPRPGWALPGRRRRCCAATAADRDLRRGLGRDRHRRTDPGAVRPGLRRPGGQPGSRPWPPSRRCCSPGRCTIT